MTLFNVAGICVDNGLPDLVFSLIWPRQFNEKGNIIFSLDPILDVLKLTLNSDVIPGLPPLNL